VASRSVLALTAVGAAAVLFVAASGSSGNTSDQPYDLDSGRSLAESVASKAKCGYVEEYSLQASDHWDFTCQIGKQMFVIRTANTPASRDAGLSGDVGYKVGPFYLVSPFQQPGLPSNPDSLKTFPGEPSTNFTPRNPPS